MQLSEVYCYSDFNTKELLIGIKPNKGLSLGVGIAKRGLSQPDSKYYVQIYTKEGERAWELLLDNAQSQRNPKSYVRYLSQGKDRYYTVVPICEMEGKDGKSASTLFGAIGFEIRNREGKAVATVSLLDKGVIHLQSNDAEEKFLLANACAALLMQDVIG